MVKIKNIFAKEVLDSRSKPTLSVIVELDDGSRGYATVPSGASTGKHEAVELRDGDQKRFKGEGVLKAVKNVNTVIKQSLVGEIATEQRSIDEKMIGLDGTLNKEKLGANAILGVSVAVSKAAANHLGKPLYVYLNDLYESEGNWKKGLGDIKRLSLPTPYFNILNGGRHADNSVDIQESMIAPSLKTFAENLRAGSEIYSALKLILNERGLGSGVGDEGGFAPNLETNSQSMDLLVEAITRAGYIPGKNVFIALDIAASELFKEEKYVLKHDSHVLTAHQLIGLYSDWLKEYPICSLEDGLSEDDFTGWKDLTERLGDNLQLVGDDLFVTNNERIKKGIEAGLGNAVLIKPNQIGTLTETFDAIKTAMDNNYKVMISHRSGETTDTFIADLAVAVGAGQIKAGAPARGERVAKYNRLLEIEEELSNG